MKRFGRYLILIAAVIFLSGCVQIDVDCGVDSSFQAYLRYYIAVDTSDLNEIELENAKKSLHRIAFRYQSDLGFEVTENYDAEGMAELELLLSVPGNSYEDAFEKLKTILTNPEITPFLEVDMRSHTTDHEQSFVFRADTNFSGLIGQSQLDALPSQLQQRVSQGMSRVNGTFTIALPGKSDMEGVVSNSDFSCTSSAPLSLDQPISLELKTRLELENGVASNKDLADSIQSLNTLNSLLPIFLCVLSALALGAVAWLVVAIRKKNHRKD